MEETENCNKQIYGGLHGNTAFRATMQDGTDYVLPPWRMNEIVLLAIETLNAQEYYKDGFDYKNMISGMGIKLKKFSSFAPENLEKFTEISLSRWNEGVCIVFPDQETGEQRSMIAYNDKRTSSECMQIIFHEFAHIMMKHTQQSINGEIEASCFAVAMWIFVTLEQQFHFSKTVANTIGKQFLVQGIKDAIQRKEAT